jgi:hypothetical protein
MAYLNLVLVVLKPLAYEINVILYVLSSSSLGLSVKILLIRAGLRFGMILSIDCLKRQELPIG